MADPFSTGNNPFVPGGGGSGGQSPAGTMDDPQNDGASSDQAMTGDSQPDASPSTQNNTATLKSLAYLVTCLACEQSGTLSRVSSKTK